MFPARIVLSANSGKRGPVPIFPLFLQTLDVVDQVAYGFQVFGLAELDAAFVFQIADEFNHVQGINSQRIEGCAVKREDIVPDYAVSTRESARS